jgi:small subunit ribosomal protein S16
MLVIRFLRVGKKNQPSFKIVVVDKRRSSKSGRFTEEVGFYNPVTKEKVLKGDRIKYWLSKGVQPSPTVHNLLIKEKILVGKKIPVHKKSKKKEEKKTEVPAAAAAVAPTASIEKEVKKVKEEKTPATPKVPEATITAEASSSPKASAEKPKIPEAKTEEKPAEKTEIPKETKVPKEGKPETK